MTEQNIFDPENIRNAVEKKSLLDELNLPPSVTKFIRANAKNLQIGIVIFVVAVIGWTAYDAYVENRRSESATMLAEALKANENAKRAELLDSVIDKYSGSDAALWGKIEKAHIADQENSTEAAIAQYEKILATLSADNPQVPLMEYSLAVSYENIGNRDKAVEYYQKVANLEGFNALANLALGRIYEQEGDTAKALELYKKADESQSAGSQVKSILASKISNLQPAEKTKDM